MQSEAKNVGPTQKEEAARFALKREGREEETLIPPLSILPPFSSRTTRGKFEGKFFLFFSPSPFSER